MGKMSREGYTILLEGRGMARLSLPVQESEVEKLKEITAFLASIHPEGGDNRRDIKDASAEVQMLARSVALLFDAQHVDEMTDGSWKLNTKPAGLLSKETFAKQEMVPGGLSGFLVGKDLLLTTAHDIEVEEIRVVFDFMVEPNGKARTTYASDEVFHVQEVDRRRNDNSGEDWLLLRLDHDPARPFREIESEDVPLGTSLWMLGHPLGLPMKFVDGAEIKKREQKVFECNLDASEGNSGSMVLDAVSKKVVGVLQGTAVGVENGIWLWCDPLKSCPTFVTSSAAFADPVTDNS